jgi:CelD/BcsL family acetyltransferase involved in cellulose biosynthesis
MSFQPIDPLEDGRWAEFLERQPNASVFHSPGWLKALKVTYGYEPVVYTSSRPGEALQDGVALCVVKTWLVQPRLVSLPFSDHCEPLVSGQENLSELLALLRKGVSEKRWSSVELRPPLVRNVAANWPQFLDDQQFVLHRMDLSSSLEQLFRLLNKDSTQRKIRKAEREGLRYEEGRSKELLDKFFRLSVMTRRRKSLPPPPFAWFRNVVEQIGERAKLRVASTRDGHPAGAVLTIHYKNTMLFKYGASDAKFHHLGTMPFLIWRAIEDAKRLGATTFDFGRSDVGHKGLIHFKDHFGAAQFALTHKVFPAVSWGTETTNWKMKAAKKVFAKLPDRVLILAGQLIYPHIG